MLLFMLVNLVLAAAIDPENRWDRWDPNCGGSPFNDAGKEQNRSQLIINGWEARPHEFPWQVSLRYTGGNHWCGGSLITPSHVVTAYHCMEGTTPDEIEVVVGEHSRSENNDNKQLKSLTAIYNHEDYMPYMLYHDISILELSSPVETSEFVNTICAPNAANDYAHLNVTTSGWGSTDPDEQVTPDVLQYTNLNSISNEECRRDPCEILAIAAGSICIGNCGTNDRDTCYGDSGGPVATKVEDDKWKIIGITSWGFGCSSQYPGVYTRVSHYLDWIDGKIALLP